MKKFLLLILIFILILNINFVDAKVKIRGSSSVIRHGLNNYILSDQRSYSFFSESDIEICKNSYTDDNFLCDSNESVILENKEAEINNLKNDIESTYVNNYDQTSVNNYNNKIDNLNNNIDNFNNLLNSKCISYKEFCKPYDCNIKFPGTIYQKSTDMCLCENGQVYNEILGKEQLNGCKKDNKYFTENINKIYLNLLSNTLLRVITSLTILVLTLYFIFRFLYKK